MSNREAITGLMDGCSAILLDVEGTTTDIAFVKNVLFPYAEQNTEQYLSENWDSEETKGLVKDFFKVLLKNHPEESLILAESKEVRFCLLLGYIKKLIKLGEKDTNLKTLQGCIWRKAYESGVITGHIYADVKPMLEKWEEQNIPVYIYSSGSIEAQKLLFRHSVEGNLTKYFSGYFDTTIGHKHQSSSYENIANAIGIPPQSIVFITDVPEEAQEAASAKMKAIISQRPGTVMHGRDIKEFPFITSFDQLQNSE